MARIYAGRTAEDRSEERRRRFVAGAIELAGTRGLANLTVRGVCDAAGLSTRFFYETFSGLDAVVLAAYDECVQTAFTTIYSAATAAGPDRTERARAAIAAIVDYLDAHPHGARLVFIEALGSHELTARRRDTMRLQEQAIAALGQDTYAVDENDPLVHVTATIVAGGVWELMVAWLDGDIDVTREQLIDHCASLLVAIGDTATALDQRRVQ